MDSVNEFFIVAEHTMYSYLAVLVKVDYAYVHCVHNETDGGLLAFSDDIPTDLPPNGISIFYTNTPTEEIQICNDYVIPKTLAQTILRELAKYQIELNEKNHRGSIQ